MRTIKTAKYMKKANYLIVTPDDSYPGYWRVVHNTFPDMSRGGGQVIGKPLPSKDAALDLAHRLATGEKDRVIVDETSSREYYDRWLKRNRKQIDTPMGLEDDNPIRDIDY